MFCYQDPILLICGILALFHYTITKASSSSSTVKISVYAAESEQTCTYISEQLFNHSLIICCSASLSLISACYLLSSATHKLLSTAPRPQKPRGSCDTGSHASSNSGTAWPGDTRRCFSGGQALRGSVALPLTHPPLPVQAWSNGHSSSVLMSQSEQTAGSEACRSTV